jgi:hypothetical protein
LNGFPSFFETMFWAIFVITLLFFVVWFVALVFRIIKTRGGIINQTTSGNPPVVKEKEIIREIVKIRCQYCGNLYDEKLDKCPHCGGKKA